MIERLAPRSSRRPAGPTFVSYSYDDGIGLEKLRALKLEGSELRPFAPISVSPAEMVSTELLSAINACSSFIFLDTPSSRRSRWVALETDYARRVGKRVFSFDPESGALQLDTAKAMDLPVFPSYARGDTSQVMEVLRVMKNERYFDVFLESEELSAGDNFAAQIEGGLNGRLERGGYALIFWTTDASRSLWVQREVDLVVRQFPSQVLLVQLGDASLPGILADRQALRIRRDSESKPDMRDVDDVIVWLYWLIQSRRLGATA